MDAKDNALRIIRFDKPQRVVGGLPSRGLAYFGCNHEGFDHPAGHDCPVSTEWSDVWGTLWRKEQPGVMGFPRFHPLAEMGALGSYNWPDPDDERICGRIHQQARAAEAEGSRAEAFLCGSHRETLWEKAYMLVGMENMMERFFTEPAFVRDVLHRIMDFQLAMARHYVAAGCDAAGLGDDLGTQTGALLGPRIVGEFLAPEYRRLFEFYRARGAIVCFHSCGNVASVVDALLDLGVDVLNPVQATANDLDALRRRTQGRMALQGAVSTATIMAGPARRIREEVRLRLWQLGREGGYFCAADQGMPFPPEHVEALNEALETYGRYPLERPEEWQAE